MDQNKLKFDLNELSRKNLLNIAESRFYLNVSKRVFAYLEHNDPTFPQRKTPTKHSRPLLDVWLEKDGSRFFDKPINHSFGNHACRFALNLDQMN